MTEIKFVTVKADGTTSTEYVTLDPRVSQLLEDAQTEWKRLEEAGTPYWCIHKDRNVSSPRAYWQDDCPDEPIHKKHGVRCRDCGGYIQEG